MGTAPSTAPRGDDTGTALRGSDYTALSRQIRSAGLLARRPGAYAVRIGVTVAFFVGTCAAIVWVGDSWYQTILAALLGVAFTQVAFLAHDGGHQQIFTRRRSADRPTGPTSEDDPNDVAGERNGPPELTRQRAQTPGVREAPHQLEPALQGRGDARGEFHGHQQSDEEHGRAHRLRPLE